MGPGITGEHFVEMIVKPGDKVIVPEYIGSEINIEHEDYRIIKQNDILAIVEN